MDLETPPTLFDIKRNGKTIPAVATVNKNALMFILNRVTGKPIYGVEERPAPQSNVPGEQTSPTQPFPLLPEPLAQNTLSRDNLYKDTPEHKAWCEQYVDSNNMLLSKVSYTPTALDRYTVGLPGTQGGVNYYGGAYDPRLGLFVVNINNLAQPMRIIRNPDGSYVNSGPLAGTVRFWDPSNHLPCTPTPWGQLVAVDVNTGKIAWRSTLGITDSFPAGKQNTGRPGLGGAIVTASGLTFLGATDDARFRAFETRTGKEIWTVKLPASAESTPITYADAKGQQYIAVVATGGFGVGAALASDTLVVFSLTGESTGTLAAPVNSPSAAPAVAASVSSSQNHLPPGPGHDLTVRVCSACHSPDLAASQRLSEQEWNSLVQNMSARGAVATDDEFDEITGYLARSFPRSAPPSK
jgi:quinoprotein glucose dehydrogenase